MSIALPIEEDPRFRRYTASQGQKVFAVPFPFQQDEDISVLLNKSGTYSEISRDLFTISGKMQPDGGSVTFHAGRMSGDTLIIVGRAVLDRLSSIVRDGRFASKLTDDEFDRNRIIQQEQHRELQRAIKAPYGKEGAELSAGSPSKLLHINQSGSIVESETPIDEKTQRENGDKALASLIGQSGPIEVPVYDTLLAARSANIKPTIHAIRTGGEISAGDHRDALYTRAPSEPSHAGKDKFDDGSWWERIDDGKIFIVSTGQSNMQRHPSYSWKPEPNLWWWNNNQGNADSTGTRFNRPAGTVINPALAFANQVAKDNPRSMVYLVNCAVGGAAIASWLPGGSPDIFQNILNNVAPALVAADVTKINALLWWQGENGGSGVTYPSDFEAVMARFRAQSWFDIATPAVLFGVTPSSRGGERRYNITNLQLQNIASQRGAYRHFVNTPAFSEDKFWDDHVHMSALGYWNVGMMAANQYAGRARFTDYRLNPEATDINEANFVFATGEYRSDVDTLNIPIAAAGLLRHEHFNFNFAVQYFDRVTIGQLWKRYKRTTWQPWYCINGIVRVSKSTDQTIVGNVATRVEFNSTTTDRHNLWKADGAELPNGYWRVDGRIRISSGLMDGENVELTIRRQDGSIVLLSNSRAKGTSGQSFEITGIVGANGTTMYSLHVQCSESGDKFIQGYTAATNLFMQALDAG